MSERLPFVLRAPSDTEKFALPSDDPAAARVERRRRAFLYSLGIFGLGALSLGKPALATTVTTKYTTSTTTSPGKADDKEDSKTDDKTEK